MTINLVQPVGQPIAFNDAVTTPQDTVVRIDADSNDSANGAPGNAIRQAAASFIVRRVPVNGTVRALRLNPGVTPQDWGFEYTPNAGFVGVDSFTYTVDDGAANFVSNPATVVVTVSAAGNANPVALNDSAVTQLNTAVIVAVLANDTDADGDLLAVTSVTNVVGGTAVQNANNTVTFTPSLGFSGAASFTYAISDGRGGTASASAGITVQLGPNTAPVAVNDTATTAFGTAVTVFVLLNDSDPDVTDVLSVSGVSNAVNGTAAINANSTAVIFTPAAGFSGQGSFSYAIADGRGGSASANVTVTVNPAPPVAVPNVVNATQAAASAAITGAGLTVGAITQASSATVPAGSVISSNPAAGTLVAPGSAVALLISTGPAQVAVPNVVNATQAAASAAITGAGLTVGAITQASSATVPAGSVISSNPAAGTLVAPGSAVALLISTGPAQVAVPTVAGLTQGAATTAITTAGLILGTVTTQSSGIVPAGFVIGSTPVAGTLVNLGSAVTWWSRAARRRCRCRPWPVDAGGGVGGDHRRRVDGWRDYPGHQCNGARGQRDQLEPGSRRVRRAGERRGARRLHGTWRSNPGADGLLAGPRQPLGRGHDDHS